MGPFHGFIDSACPVDWAHPLNRGLVADYTILPVPGWRGGATVRDLVRGGRKPNDGSFVVVTPAAAWGGAKGRPGGYGRLDFSAANTQYATHPPPALTATPALSVSLWVLLPASPGDLTDFLGKWDNGGTTRQHFCRYSSGLQWFINQSSDAAQASVTIPAASLALGGWNHVAFVADGSNLSGYLNGVLKAGPTALSGPYLPSDTTAWGIGFGRSTPGQAHFDAVRYYSRAMSAAQVRALYDQQRAGSPDLYRWVRPVAYSLPATGGAQTATPGTATASIAVVDVAAGGTGAATAAPGTAAVTLSAIAPAVSPTGPAPATAATVTVAVSAVATAATASGTGTATPGVATVTVAAVAPAGSPSGAAPAAAGVAVVTVSATGPAASGSGTGAASPVAASVAVTAVDVTASGDAAIATAGAASVGVSVVDVSAAAGGAAVVISTTAAVAASAFDATATVSGAAPAVPGAAAAGVVAVDADASGLGTGTATPGVAVVAVVAADATSVLGGFVYGPLFVAAGMGYSPGMVAGRGCAPGMAKGGGGG
jgi:hypothetical protein